MTHTHPTRSENIQSAIDSLERRRDRRRTINAEIRKGPGWQDRIDPPLADHERAELDDFARSHKREGYPGPHIANISTQITRLRARLAMVELLQADLLEARKQETA